MTVKTNVLTEGFEAALAVTVDTPLAASTDIAFAGSKSLKLIGVLTSAKYFETTSLTGDAGANDEVSCYFRNADAAYTGLGYLTVSVVSSMLGNGATGTAYVLVLQIAGSTSGGSDSLTLYSITGGGGPVTISSSATPTLIEGVWYRPSLRRTFDNNGNGWITVRLMRASDSAYLHIDGTWVAEVADTFRVQDNTFNATGPRKAGGCMNSLNVLNQVYADVFNFDTVYPNGLFAHGDSNTYGALATAPWVETLGTALATTIQNHGIPGYQIVDIAGDLYTSKRFKHACTFVGGTNDARTAGYGTNATKRGFAMSALRASICRASFNSVTLAQAMTKSGTWTNNIGYDGTTSCYSNEAAATLTGTATGDVIYVGYAGMDDTFDGTFSVTVGGVVKVASQSCAAAGIKTTANANRTQYCPQALRISGCGAGSHTVVITNLGSGGNHFSFIDWIAGVGDQSSAKSVFVGNVTYLNAAGYVTYGGSSGNIDSYNTDIATEVSNLAGDGHPVYLAALNSGYDPTTMLGSDNIHHNNTGHAFLEAKFETAFKPAAPTIGTAVVVNATTVNVPFTAGLPGGSTIIDYVATSSPGGFTGTLTQAGSGTVVVTAAFVAAQAYTFTVAPRNSYGTGTSSAASNSVTPNIVASNVGAAGGGIYRSSGRNMRGKRGR